MTGFLFSSGVSIAAGAVAGSRYLMFYLIARPNLVSLSFADPLFLQDLSGAPVYIIKAVMVFFSGLVVGIASRNSRRLISRIVAEEQERSAIDRLFGQYVSEEIKNKIIAEKEGLIGESRRVVVLFSDIRSFSTISENNPPERIVSSLNAYFSEMVDCIHSEGGVVDKFVGDAIMAIFGGLTPLKSSAGSAVRAGIAMRERLTALNATATEGQIEFDNGIGVHFGDVIQGAIGSLDRKKFTVIGDSVNTASRIEGLTKNVTANVLISREVYENIDEPLRNRFGKIGSTTVKGKSIPVEVFGLT